MTQAFSTSEVVDSYAAAIGDAQHRLDVHLILGTFGNRIDREYLSNNSQSIWLRENYPQFVPPNDPAGNPPSVHRLGQIFETNYANNTQFRVTYIGYLTKRRYE